MTISVFGLGYVGAVTSGCLSQIGHQIIGVDVHEPKVRAFNEGRSPIVEPELDDMLQTACKDGRLRATTAAAEAVAASSISIICVGTPSLPSGSLDLGYVTHVTQQIAAALRQQAKKHVVVFRSTMLPGSTRRMVNDQFADLLESGQLQVYYCPEFLREGTAVADFREPSLAVVGTDDGNAPACPEILSLFGGTPSILRWEGAEMIKYACNYFHALKVGFANEIGRLSKHLDEDALRVMDVVCQDTRLNISRYYMRPGAPFGGSCLPKDVSALRSFARQQGINLPLLDNTQATNDAHQQQFVQLIEKSGKRRIGFIGLAFKADTDDLRGSPLVAAAETLIGRGHAVSIYDPHINLSRLIGSNEQQIQARMPHLAQLLKQDASEVIESSDVLVISQKCVPAATLQDCVRPEQIVIDVNGWAALQALPCRYDGLCW
ncbi:MAG: UDP-glucose/GDP-mannose dehydrogenase family protein [Prosthecobacter sp.]|uniref:nucleotide sugar dehydrogenase n=1 Tax=Prosthecobacter sp. TaxID=1965333 RepID=UPI0019DD547E|nr:nucleotide sugar dehydrogenase [Prosthecobacter sp.]MBE2287161.1 UDP-glucose/GDP-mannose dehydrogenase family protein [Prosthecobacter sp.]